MYLYHVYGQKKFNGDSLLSVLKLVVVPRGFQGDAVHCDLCFKDFLVGGQVGDSPAYHLEQFLLHMHGVVGVLVHIYGVAGCLLEGSVQACLQVEGHIQEVGYFDVDLGGNTQVVLRKKFDNLLL